MVDDRYTRKGFLKLGGATAVTASLGSLLGACGGGGGGGGGGAKTLKVSMDKVAWKKWFVTEGKAAQQAIGVGWNVQAYADTTTYQAAIRTAGTTPKVPDVFSWWSQWLMRELVDAGIVADLSSVWDKQGAAYSPDVRKAFTFNGKSYGVPLNIAYWVVLYNKHVFAKHNLEVPKTWADFTGVLDKLRGEKITPLGATVDGRWPSFDYFQELMIRTDPSLYQAVVDGKAKYTDPSVVDVMNLWGKLIKQGNFSNPSAVTIGTGTSNFEPLFKKGKIAMLQWGTWIEPQIVAAGMKAGDDYGAFIMPNVSSSAPNTVIFETGPLVAGARSRNLDEATKLLGWFASKDGQATWIKATGFTSPRKDVPSAGVVDQELDKTIQEGGYKLLNRYWEATPHDIVETAVDQFTKFMLHPGDPRPILGAIQRQADQSFAKQA